MKPIIFTILFISNQFISFSQKTVTVPAFESISVSGNITAKLVKGSSPKIEYTVKKGDAEDFKYTVKNNKLVLEIKSSGSWFWNSNKTKIDAIVYYTELNEIKTSAGSYLSSSDKIVSNDMEVGASSGSRLEVGISCKTATISASSGSAIDLTGSVVDSGKFDASSGSSIEADGLSVGKVDADASSGASIEVWPLQNLTADASSGASIRYKGKPGGLVDIDKSSGGSVRQL